MPTRSAARLTPPPAPPPSELDQERAWRVLLWARLDALEAPLHRVNALADVLSTYADHGAGSPLPDNFDWVFRLLRAEIEALLTLYHSKGGREATHAAA